MIIMIIIDLFTQYYSELNSKRYGVQVKIHRRLTLFELDYAHNNALS